METQQKDDILAALSTFDALSTMTDENLREVAKNSTVVEFREGQCIFRLHDRADHVYFVMDGAVSLVAPRKDVGARQLMKLRAGDLLGWSPLVGNKHLTASAFATSNATLLKISADTLNELQDRCPVSFGRLMVRVAKILSERLTATRLHILDICGVGLPEFQVESD